MWFEMGQKNPITGSRISRGKKQNQKWTNKINRSAVAKTGNMTGEEWDKIEFNSRPPDFRN